MGLRNKASLTTGEIVEYDEAIEVDPADPETPKPTGNCETKYLGVGEIVEVRSTPHTQDGQLLHLWEYLNVTKPRVLFVDGNAFLGDESTATPNPIPRMTPEQLLQLMDSAPDEDGYRRSTEFQPALKTQQFPWNPPQIFPGYKAH